MRGGSRRRHYSHTTTTNHGVVLLVNIKNLTMHSVISILRLLVRNGHFLLRRGRVYERMLQPLRCANVIRTYVLLIFQGRPLKLNNRIAVSNSTTEEIVCLSIVIPVNWCLARESHLPTMVNTCTYLSILGCARLISLRQAWWEVHMTLNLRGSWYIDL